MGSCNCTQQATAQPELDIKAERLMHKQGQQAEILTAIEDPFQPTAQPEPQLKAPVPVDILPLQSIVRGYLGRKGLKAVQKDWLDLGSGQSTEAENREEAKEDPTALLSKEAKSTMGRLLPFNYRQRVRDVARLSAQRLADGSIYVGQWITTANGAVRQGQGKLYKKDGGYIEGYWQAGKPHFQARCIFPNGDHYEGQFSQGLKSGSGHFATFDSSQTYTGQWANDKRNGTGLEVTPDINYEGHFFNDAKTGRGKFQWTDGSWYEGDLLNGEIDGEGEYHWSDGRWYRGQWKEGKMHGKGAYITADGKKYVGDYVQDRREGQGVYKWGNNTYDGQWQGNKMHGFGYMSVGDGPRKRCEFQEGSKVKELPDS